MMLFMKAVIMAGGYGKRMAEVFPDIPKPLIPIENKPVLERQIEVLRKQGITELILTVSHMKEKIKEYFGNGERYGVNISYFDEETPLGNAGALLYLKEELCDDFLLLNADTVYEVDFQKLIEYHRSKNSDITLLTHPNSHPYDSVLVLAGKDKKITSWITKEEKRPEYYKNRVNAGIHVISPIVFDALKLNEKGKLDLDREVIQPAIASGRVYCYDSPEYVRDMGTPERYRSVCDDIKKKRIPFAKEQRKAIFLDRDGTINRYAGFIRTPEEFELLPDASKAIKMINESGYLAIVVSNQPVIARGEITEDRLETIHNKMETLLGDDGAYLDAIYYCPHHPDTGFKGEISELKIKCKCRKPEPGMLIKATEDLNIEMKSSWMIGDSWRDIKAGKAAGCGTLLVGTDELEQDMTATSLSEAVRKILEKE